MSFIESKDTTGKLGEDYARIMLLKSKKTIKVIDISEEPIYWEKDIDFIWLYQDQTGEIKICKIEVKLDTIGLDTGNIFYETKDRGKKGCMARSEADLVYYFLNHNDGIPPLMLIIPLPRLKRYLAIHPKKETTSKEGSIGYVIPINELTENGLAIRYVRKKGSELIWQKEECSQRR